MADRIERFHIFFLLMLFCFFVILFTGCAQYQPRSVENLSFLDRAQTQEEEDVRVTVAVPSAEEVEQTFKVPLYRHGT